MKGRQSATGRSNWEEGGYLGGGWVTRCNGVPGRRGVTTGKRGNWGEGRQLGGGG